MAAASASCSSSTTSLIIPELGFLSPRTVPTSHRVAFLSRRVAISTEFSSLSRKFLRYNRTSEVLRHGIRALRDDTVVVREDETDLKLLNELNSNGNGSGNGAVNGSYSEAVDNAVGSVNGEVSVVESNGSLVKYVNGNGSVAEEEEEGEEAVVVERDSVEVVEMNEDARKKRIEKIGEEEAWFKKAGPGQVEVWNANLYNPVSFQCLIELGISRFSFECAMILLGLGIGGILL